MKNKVILFAVLVVAGVLVYKGGYLKSKSEILPSQKVIQTAMDVVRDKKPTPVQAAIFYSLVAGDYYHGVYTNKILDNQEKINEVFATTSLQAVLQDVVDQDNKNSEGFKMKTGVENWNMTKGWTKEVQKPFSPNGGMMPRFVLDENFTYQVPTPPVYGGAEFKAGLAEVKDVASKRTPEQGALVNFWGGIPGSEGPSGIWLNRLDFYTKKYNLSDEKYAYAQMVLAESLADSFMECWKVKFIYQTKRPDMTDKTITVVQAMANPPFPSYVSGHATISFTAVTVLAQMFPADKGALFQDALDAKNSRLNAGIHFSYDNNEGEKLGRAVGEFVVNKLSLQVVK